MLGNIQPKTVFNTRQKALRLINKNTKSRIMTHMHRITVEFVILRDITLVTVGYMPSNAIYSINEPNGHESW